jgi:hypothetical protein
MGNDQHQASGQSSDLHKVLGEIDDLIDKISAKTVVGDDVVRKRTTLLVLRTAKKFLEDSCLEGGNPGYFYYNF